MATRLEGAGWGMSVDTWCLVRLSGIHPLEHGLLVVGVATAFRKTIWLISRYWSSRLSWHGSTWASCFIKLRLFSSRSLLCHFIYLPSVSHGAEVWETALHQVFAEVHPCEASHLLLAGDLQVALGAPRNEEQQILGSAFSCQERSPLAGSLMSSHGMEATNDSLAKWQVDNWTTDQLQAGARSDHVLVGISLKLAECVRQPPKIQKLRRPLNSAIPESRWWKDPGAAM
eukprot:5957478-Amphidinium_carterae.2